MWAMRVKLKGTNVVVPADDNLQSTSRVHGFEQESHQRLMMHVCQTESEQLEVACSSCVRLECEQ